MMTETEVHRQGPRMMIVIVAAMTQTGGAVRASHASGPARSQRSDRRDPKTKTEDENAQIATKSESVVMRTHRDLTEIGNRKTVNEIRSASGNLPVTPRRPLQVGVAATPLELEVAAPPAAVDTAVNLAAVQTAAGGRRPRSDLTATVTTAIAIEPQRRRRRQAPLEIGVGSGRTATRHQRQYDMKCVCTLLPCNYQSWNLRR